MPTRDNPAHFETGSLMPGRFDPFFKWLSLDVKEERQTGECEASSGLVTLIYVESVYEVDEYLEQIQYGSSVSREELLLFVTTGWYVTRQDDNGLIWAFEFGDGTLAEENARREFEGSRAAYEHWLDQPVFGD